MHNNCNTNILEFHTLTVDDCQAVRSITLAAGRRNCNYTFANLIGWQFWFHTEVCICQQCVVFRFNIEGRRAYMLCSAALPTLALMELLCADAAAVGADILIMGLEDIENVLTAAPYATVIASHMDNVGHATLWRKDIRDFAAKRNLGSRLLIPEDGEICDHP